MLFTSQYTAQQSGATFLFSRLEPRFTDTVGYNALHFYAKMSRNKNQRRIFWLTWRGRWLILPIPSLKSKCKCGLDSAKQDMKMKVPCKYSGKMPSAWDSNSFLLPATTMLSGQCLAVSNWKPNKLHFGTTCCQRRVDEPGRMASVMAVCGVLRTRHPFPPKMS